MRHLTVSEAAQTLSLSVPTIKRYLYEGKLKSSKLPGGQHRIPETEIERLLAPEAESRPVEDSRQPCAEVDRRVDVLEKWVTDLQAEIESLHATLEVMSRYCASVQESVQHGATQESAARDSASGHRVIVLGPGCKRCDSLHETAETALRDAGRDDVSVERITHLDDIAAFGPILTPALVVDDQIVVSGRVPSEKALGKMLLRHLG